MVISKPCHDAQTSRLAVIQTFHDAIMDPCMDLSALQVYLSDQSYGKLCLPCQHMVDASMDEVQQTRKESVAKSVAKSATKGSTASTGLYGEAHCPICL